MSSAKYALMQMLFILGLIGLMVLTIFGASNDILWIEIVTGIVWGVLFLGVVFACLWAVAERNSR